MAEAKKSEGDLELRKLFEEFDGQLVTPGGAAALTGLSRSTISTLMKRGELRSFRNLDQRKREEKDGNPADSDPAWVYIPLEDVKRYANKVGRPFPGSTLGVSP